MKSQNALLYLWLIAGLNFVVGGIIWLAQREELDNSYSSNGDALVWSAIGTNLVGFAALVFVITFATHAIVGAIEENRRED